MNKLYEHGWVNKLAIAVAIAGVILTYLFQDFSFLSTWPIAENTQFVLRKIFRVFLNDLFMLLFIAAWFKEWRFTRLAIAIQLVDGLILLPIYLVFKLSLEGSSEISLPLLSQFHRLIVNPTLMILLIPAVYFQKFSRSE